MNKNKICWILSILTLFLFIFCFLEIPKTQSAEDEKESILELQDQIQEKSREIDEINKRISTYEQEIDELENQATSLKRHINILDNQINKTEGEINLLSNQIQQIELEIKKLNLDINLTQEEIDKKLKEIEVILREINNLDDEYLGSQEAESQGIVDLIFNFFKVVLKYSSWSEYEKTVEDTKTINEALKQKKDDLAVLKANLEADKKQAENKARDLTDKQTQLQKKKGFLASEKQSKRDILAQTQANEEKYEDLLEKAAQAQKALNREVIVLKDEVKKKIARLQQGARSLTSILTWPLAGYRRITSYFHDPTYPYRKYFEHNAIDIACPQGTPIRAPAAGYVARTRNAGYGYNYITLIHTENLQTRYGHVSAFAASEGNFVKAGQIIGYTGGMPGTPGAGYLTSGPHLHFEVRIGSETDEGYTAWQAVNPLNYLP